MKQYICIKILMVFLNLMNRGSQVMYRKVNGFCRRTEYINNERLKLVLNNDTIF